MVAEVGVITAHPLYMAYKMACSILKTWRYASKLGLPANKWYGVYEPGSEMVLAQMGCSPGAEARAIRLANDMNHSG
jgi:hypothetical protein